MNEVVIESRHVRVVFPDGLTIEVNSEHGETAIRMESSEDNRIFLDRKMSWFSFDWKRVAKFVVRKV